MRGRTVRVHVKCGHGFRGPTCGKISARDACACCHATCCSPSPMALTSTGKQPLKPSSSSKKRKSSDRTDADDLENPSSHPPKQPKINAFFTPRVSLSTTCGTDKTTTVAKLSEEQNRVLQLVLEERQNVFFTGSAGACFLVAV